MRVLCTLLLLAAPVLPQSPPDGPDHPIDAAVRHRISEDVATKVTASYVYPEAGEKIAVFIRKRDKEGAYSSITSSQAFARALTGDLQSISHDKHLHVFYGGGPAHGMPDPSLFNFGYEKAERLAGNVGYLDVRGFLPRELAQQTGAAAMAFLGRTDALIIDVRHNNGGDPSGVAFLCSYLFGDKAVHLNDLFWRPGGRTDQFWTDPKVPGERYGPDKPVYVLTSNRTFSAAEEFTYDLQQQKRATIVGEVTGGGAHPGGVQQLGDEFSIFIPTGRAINPVSKKDWEGAGVVPEIRTSAADALKTAHTAAIRGLLSKTTDPARKATLNEALTEVDQDK